MSQKYTKITYIKRQLVLFSTGYFTFKGVWCSESVQLYCLSAHLMWPHWLKCGVLCLLGLSLHLLVEPRPLPAHCLLLPRLRCNQTRRCHCYRSLTCHLQSQSKPQPRGRYNDLVAGTGTGLLWETICTINNTEINIFLFSVLVIWISLHFPAV